MDRELLKEEIYKLKENKTEHINKEERNKLIKETIKYYGDGTGKLNLLIVVEELAELQEELIMDWKYEGEYSLEIEYKTILDNIDNN